MNRQVVKTRDNSSTIFVPELDEHYHSVHGALQESRHVFIDAGLHHLLESGNTDIHILEVGFGTGLNAWLSALEIAGTNLRIRYTALEKYPVSQEEIHELNYGEILGEESSGKLFKELHEADWENWARITSNFQIFKHQTDLKSFSAKEAFDLVYFDAFAPSAQPDLWTEEIFNRVFSSLKTKGILVTYCVKGEVRRNMKTAGFEVEKIPGPPGKREMARATKPELKKTSLP